MFKKKLKNPFCPGWSLEKVQPLWDWWTSWSRSNAWEVLNNFLCTMTDNFWQKVKTCAKLANNISSICTDLVYLLMKLSKKTTGKWSPPPSNRPTHALHECREILGGPKICFRVLFCKIGTWHKFPSKYTTQNMRKKSGKNCQNNVNVCNSLRICPQDAGEVFQYYQSFLHCMFWTIIATFIHQKENFQKNSEK